MTKWRIIKSRPFNAFMNMALDEVIADEISESKADPTIRFYTWEPSAVSVGYFQSVKQEVNEDNCIKEGIDIVRRRTGGGAVYHDKKGELTYTVIGKQELFPEDIIESYKVICGSIIKGLKELNIESEFKPINDVIVDGKKISGNAQTRRKKTVLQHGTVLYNVDVEKMFSYLNVSREKVSDKLIKSVKKRVAGILDYSNSSLNEVEEAMIKGFSESKEFYFGDYTENEIKLAERLAEEKYKTNEWNYLL